jgi:hypothetical protein
VNHLDGIIAPPLQFRTSASQLFQLAFSDRHEIQKPVEHVAGHSVRRYLPLDRRHVALDIG